MKYPKCKYCKWEYFESYDTDFVGYCSERCKRLDKSVKKELGIDKEREDRAAE